MYKYKTVKGPVSSYLDQLCVRVNNYNPLQVMWQWFEQCILIKHNTYVNQIHLWSCDMLQ